MKLRRFSFKTKLIVSIEIFVIAVNSIFGYAIWKQLNYMSREISRQKLMTIAKTAAYYIDAEKLEKIKTKDDENSKEYKKLHGKLKEIMEANPEIDDVYTLRKSEGKNWIFVIEGMETKDADGDGIITEKETAASVEEPFDSSDSPEVENAMDGTVTADFSTNCDKWGCFLSGYAPIADQDKKIIGVAAVDIRAEDVRNFEKKLQITIASILGALFILFPILIYLLLLILVRPIKKIISGISMFKEDLSYRLKINTGDEFEVISDTFNEMARDLDGLYTKLEDRVQEKTKDLRNKITEIEEKKAKDDALLSSIGEGMVATDRRGKIIIANDQAGIIIGIPKKEIIGKETSELYTLLDEKEKPIPNDEWPIRKALLQKIKISETVWCETKNGHKIPLIITASPVIFKGKVIGSIIVYRDFTKEKEIDKAKSEFVSLASHQLLTPLANVRWQTELLAENKDASDEKKQEYLERIEKSSLRMVELVNSLLNVSRIEMGSFDIMTQNINLPELVDNVIEEQEHEAARKNIVISKKINPSISDFNADFKLLRMVFQNLLSNSIKYTPENGKVEITIKTQDGEYIFKISDNGYGIPEKQKSKIFTKLFRADNVRERVTDGTGLGLYLIKSIVENSGGKIRFDSVENKGTTFFITFPLSGMKSQKGNTKLI